MEVWLLISLVLPLGAALLMLMPAEAARAAGRAVAPWAGAPALLLALMVETGAEANAGWLLLDTRFELDEAARVLLAMTALLWTIAGVYGRAYMRQEPAPQRFFVFFALTLTGNLGLIVAGDVVGFYLFFALMTFAAYGLVVHDGREESVRAGRVYMAMAVAGELMILAGLLLVFHAGEGGDLRRVPAAVAESPHMGLITALVLGGFGVKAGALGLHMWLPLAHPAAPTPASAVLSGTMIKAGLLAWMRFLPLGEAAVGGWGALCIVVGLAGAFYGVVIGVTQVNPKTNLAYSSVSQMGIMMVGVGIALAEPAAWPIALPALLVYMVHHGLAKGALFLGVGVWSGGLAAGHEPRGVWRRWLLTGGLAINALALAGAPLTSGYLAKVLLKDVAPMVGEGWYGVVDTLLGLSAVGTAVLMGRFLWLTRPGLAEAHGGVDQHAKRGLWGPWLAAIVAAALAAWATPAWFELAIGEPVYWGAAALWSGTWPVLVGGGLVLLGLRLGPTLRPAQVPAGDVVLVIEWLWRRVRRDWHVGVVRPYLLAAEFSRARWNRLVLKLVATAGAAELGLVRWVVAGTAMLLVLATIYVLMWLG